MRSSRRSDFVITSLHAPGRSDVFLLMWPSLLVTWTETLHAAFTSSIWPLQKADSENYISISTFVVSATTKSADNKSLHGQRVSECNAVAPKRFHRSSDELIMWTKFILPFEDDRLYLIMVMQSISFFLIVFICTSKKTLSNQNM